MYVYLRLLVHILLRILVAGLGYVVALTLVKQSETGEGRQRAKGCPYRLLRHNLILGIAHLLLVSIACFIG